MNDAKESQSFAYNAPALIKLDTQQCRAAYVDDTAVITAGAGAGKTRTLVGRFLYLVLEQHIDPARILALTFTRKAAAEMFQRVNEALAVSATEKPELLQGLTAAHIQTLDSFCHEIVAEAAPLYGYTVDFQIDEIACHRIAAKTAYRYVLANMEAPGLKNFIAAFGFPRVIENLFTSFGEANVAPSWEGAHICQKSAEKGAQECEKTVHELAGALRDLASQILAFATSIDVAQTKEGTKITLAAARAICARNSDLECLAQYRTFMKDPTHAINLKQFGRNNSETAIKELARQLRDEHFLNKVSQLLDFEEFLPN